MKIGSIVEIRFMDHCCTVGGMSKPIECVAFGLVVQQDDDAVYLASWLDNDDQDAANWDTHSILKCAITSSQTLLTKWSRDKPKKKVMKIEKPALE